MISCGSVVAAQHDGVGHARHRRVGVALAPAVAGRLDAHQAGVLAVLHQADQPAVLDQHVALRRRALVVDGERAAAVGERAVIDHGDAGRGDHVAHHLGEHRGLLAVEVAFQPVADRLVPQHARPARPQHDRHLAGGRRDRLQVDQRLADRLVGLALPVLRLEDVAVGGALAAAGAARFHAAAVGADHADVQPHQRPHVGGAPAAGADDLDDLPRGRQRDRDLARLGLLAAHIGVDLLEQRHLLGEGLAVDRIVVGIEQPVGAARRFVRSCRTCRRAPP